MFLYLKAQSKYELIQQLTKDYTIENAHDIKAKELRCNIFPITEGLDRGFNCPLSVKNWVSCQLTTCY